MGNQHIGQFILPYWQFLVKVRDSHWDFKEQMVSAWHELRPKERDALRMDLEVYRASGQSSPGLPR